MNNHIVVRPSADRVAVKTHIEAALMRHAQLDANNIRVSVSGDRVMLSGNVPSWAEREAAERAAWGSPGVRSTRPPITRYLKAGPNGVAQESTAYREDVEQLRLAV